MYATIELPIVQQLAFASKLTTFNIQAIDDFTFVYSFVRNLIETKLQLSKTRVIS